MIQKIILQIKKSNTILLLSYNNVFITKQWVICDDIYNTIYIFIKSRQKNKRKFLCATIVSLIIYRIIFGTIYDLLGVKKDNDSIKEMASIPSQQIARVYAYNSNVFDEEDLTNLKFFYNDLNGLMSSAIKNPCIADNTKKRLNIDSVENEKIKYLKFWIKIGFKDKKII